METAKPENISQVNKSAIIQLLCKNGPLSRAEITRALNMSFPTVSQNTRQLLDEGYLLEVGESSGKDGLGRRSVLLSFNKMRGYVVGVIFNINRVVVSCADLLGNVIASLEKKMDLRKDGEYAYALIRDTIYEVIAKSGYTMDKLECICLGIPGIYDESIHKNCFVPYLESWEDIQIISRLKKEFIDNIIVENVVNLGVIGETWKGNAHEYNDVVYIDYEVGISAGIIINGEVYRGRSGVAGEIGYMILDLGQIKSCFSNEGALEHSISGVAVSEMENQITGEKNENYSLASLLKLVKEGNQKAENYMDGILRNVIAMLVNLVAVLNPEVIILSGENGKQIFDHYKDDINERLKRMIPSPPVIREAKYSGMQTGINGALYVAMNNAPSNKTFDYWI